MHGAPGSKKGSAATAGLIAGLIDTGITLVAALAANSSVLLADFFKTLLEFVAVLLAWLALRRIQRGHAHQFDYGIGKLENLSSLFVGVLMVSCIGVILFNAVRNIMHPAHIAGIGIWIGAADQIIYVGLNSWLAGRTRRQAAATGSPIMAAQARLLFTRAIGNGFILTSLALSLGLAHYGWARYIDPAASLLVAVSILLAATGILKSSFLDLLDRTLEEESQIVILRELAAHFDEYDALHGVRSRHSGSRIYVEIFLQFSPEKTMAEAQKTAAHLRQAIEGKIRSSQVTIALADEKVC